MNTAKNAVFIGLELENCYSMEEGGIDFWLGGGDIFQVGDMIEFLAGGGGLPPSPKQGKPCTNYICFQSL